MHIIIIKGKSIIGIHKERDQIISQVSATGPCMCACACVHDFHEYGLIIYGHFTCTCIHTSGLFIPRLNIIKKNINHVLLT